MCVNLDTNNNVCPVCGMAHDQNTNCCPPKVLEVLKLRGYVNTEE